ncbi:right-handed parallel beta-helix repeat-containing protein [Sinomonas mesophila]|uniref:right-handed parallel beta-helix repeat-containing protein n=1 Tax=Sinomonas mesophila TaxID=1531955 RepID=UPI0009857F4E|nr:right-handed parallel beta-helix repeat-containing protein [Sinomonas mesophila]
MATVYDVTTWTVPGNPGLTAAYDIGAVINSIIADVKAQQTSQASKPGAVIYIPPGDYSLKTRVTVDVSYLTIRGSGHGFTSSSIRYNAGNTSSWHEVNPGGSRVRVENTDGQGEAFRVARGGDPRLSSVTFENFCLDGVSFAPHQNSYLNGKTGILVDTANDAFRVQGMGMVYLEHGLVVRDADALRVSGNFLAECGSCVELVGSGQASAVTDNHLGAGYVGFGLFAEGHAGLLVAANNVFPRGKSLVQLKNCSRSTITANRLHGFYPGLIVFEGACDENLVQGNHLVRQPEPWGPMQPYGNGRDDLFGLVHVRGSGNTITGNHLSYDVPSAQVAPSGATPTIVLVASGSGNFIATNHTRASLPVKTVVLDASTSGSIVVDSGTDEQFVHHGAQHSFRATP